MNIDQISRNRLFEDRKTKTLVDGMKDSIIAALNAKSENKGNEEVLKLVVKREEEQELLNSVDKIGKALVMFYKVITRPIQWPKIFQVKGEVEVSKLPPVKISNFPDQERYLERIEGRLTQLITAITTMPEPKIEMPKFNFPKMDLGNMARMEELLSRIEEGVSKIKSPKIEFPDSFSVNNFPPVMTPTPVTHISINSLNGAFLATQVTVGTTPTLVPPTNMAQRRSLTIYNGSANTIYLGGPTVAVAGTGQGLPILTQSYSPIFDAGVNMTCYAIATSPSTVNVLEISDEMSGR